MRDFYTNYIPDLTERYPEGFGGVNPYTDDLYLQERFGKYDDIACTECDENLGIGHLIDMFVETGER